MRYFIVYFTYRFVSNSSISWPWNITIKSDCYPSRAFIQNRINIAIFDRFGINGFAGITSIQELPEQDFNDFNS